MNNTIIALDKKIHFIELLFFYCIIISSFVYIFFSDYHLLFACFAVNIFIAVILKINFKILFSRLIFILVLAGCLAIAGYLKNEIQIVKLALTRFFLSVFTVKLFCAAVDNSIIIAIFQKHILLLPFINIEKKKKILIIFSLAYIILSEIFFIGKIKLIFKKNVDFTEAISDYFRQINSLIDKYLSIEIFS